MGNSRRAARLRRISRRELLRGASAFALGAGVARGDALARAFDDRPAAAPPRSSDAGGSAPPPPALPWWLERERARSRVVEVRSERVLRAAAADRVTLHTMLERAVQSLTDTVRLTDAWRAILGSATRIAIKFNSVGAEKIGTSDVLARVLVDQLREAGYAPANVTLVEVREHVLHTTGARPPVEGWGIEIPLGFEREQVAAYLTEADAVINVGFLKTHAIAGLSGCMKNLAYGVIRHPARYHAGACSPYVPQIIGAEPVAARLKLNILDCLRVVVDHGPEAEESDIVGCGELLAGFDPAAVDSVGLGLLSVERRRRGIEAPLRVPYLVAAGEFNVGRWRPADVERVVLAPVR